MVTALVVERMEVVISFARRIVFFSRCTCKMLRCSIMSTGVEGSFIGCCFFSFFLSEPFLEGSSLLIYSFAYLYRFSSYLTFEMDSPTISNTLRVGAASIGITIFGRDMLTS